MRSSPPIYKQIKHISPARLQSRLQSSREIKLILTAPSFRQIKFIFTARLQSRLSSPKHQQLRSLSIYIQIKLILAAQLRNSCQVLRKPNLAGKPPVKFKTYQIDFHSTAAGQPAKLQTTNSFYNFAGCSTAMLGNKVALFRTWQAAMQLCLGIGLIWSELGR